MVTKLRNNKILCIIWILFCSLFFIAAIKQYSIDSLDGYFCRHSIDYTNQYSLTPPTTPAYTTEDISASYTVVSYSDNVTMPTASDYTGYTAFIFYMTMAGFLLCIIGGFFFNGFHPKLYQEVFLSIVVLGTPKEWNVSRRNFTPTSFFSFLWAAAALW